MTARDGLSGSDTLSATFMVMISEPIRREVPSARSSRSWKSTSAPTNSMISVTRRELSNWCHQPSSVENQATVPFSWRSKLNPS